MADSDIPSPCNLSVATGRSKRRDLYELMGIYVLILVVIWTPRPWQKMLWVVAALSISYVAWASYEGLKPMGLCTANLLRSLWGVALAVAVAIARATPHRERRRFAVHRPIGFKPSYDAHAT